MTQRDEKQRQRASTRTRRTGRPWRDDEDSAGASRDEARVMDLARKLVRGGAEIVFNTQGAIRERTTEFKRKEIPKELVESVAHLTARTKDEVVRLIAREFKNYLEQLDLGDELRTLAEDYTLDINMSIRLRPNDALNGAQAPQTSDTGPGAGDPPDTVDEDRNAGDDDGAQNVE